MGLNKLDFLSPPPKAFIFQENSNKTNFGGVFSLIYFLIFIILSIYYISLYVLDDNYSLEYFFYEKILDTKQYIKKINDERYNPLFNMNVYLLDGYWEEMLPPDNRFVVIDAGSPTHPNFNYRFFQRKRFSDLKYIVAYDCLNNTKENCTIEKNVLKNGYLTFMLIYNGFVFEPQNKTVPLFRAELRINYDIHVDEPEFISERWSIVKYREKEGFFSFFDKLKNKDDEDYGKYIGLRPTSRDTVGIKDPFYFDEVNKRSYLVLGDINFILDLDHYEEYKRTPKSLLNTLANICSLSLTIFNGFCLVFSKFYSNSFDTYKIIEKSLFNQKFENYKGHKDIDINKTNNNNEMIELKNDFNSNKTDSLVDKSNNQTEENGNENEKDLIAKTDEIDKRLPKLNFFDFIFNNIYGIKCCKRNLKQEIISKCHEIISKYYSIEYLLYSQIKLENLFKDYKWNDPGLNNCTNNQLIIQLKNLISSFRDTDDTNNDDDIQLILND